MKVSIGELEMEARKVEVTWATSGEKRGSGSGLGDGEDD